MKKKTFSNISSIPFRYYLIFITNLKLTSLLLIISMITLFVVFDLFGTLLMSIGIDNILLGLFFIAFCFKYLNIFLSLDFGKVISQNLKNSAGYFFITICVIIYFYRCFTFFYPIVISIKLKETIMILLEDFIREQL